MLNKLPKKEYDLPPSNDLQIAVEHLQLRIRRLEELQSWQARRWKFWESVKRVKHRIIDLYIDALTWHYDRVKHKRSLVLKK